MREEIAIEAAKSLKVQWTHTEPLYDEDVQFEQMRRAPIVEVQTGFEAGDVQGVFDGSAEVLEADFHFACQLHAMLGPSCAVADVPGDRATIWSGTQWPDGDRKDIAAMLGFPAENVRLIYREAAGSYGRLGCDAAAADAALMSKLVGKPVRVQWSRRDENGWEPVSAAMSMEVKAVLDGAGRLTAFDYMQWSSTHASAERGAYVSWNLIGIAPGNDRLEGCLHSLHYDFANKRGRTVFLEPTLRTIHLRGPGSVQSHFAIESFMDALAARTGADPVEFRLRYLAERDQEVLRTAAKLAEWRFGDNGGKSAAPAQAGNAGPGTGQSADGEWTMGRGAAYTRSGLKPTRVGVIVDVRVNAETGEVVVDRVFMAHDCGCMVNSDGVLNRVQGNIVHALSRALFEEVHYTRSGITTLDWASYKVIRFVNLPDIRIELMQRLDLEPSVVGETSSIPMVAAVANAICNATGARPRAGPFTPERVLEALRDSQTQEASAY